MKYETQQSVKLFTKLVIAYTVFCVTYCWIVV